MTAATWDFLFVSRDEPTEKRGTFCDEAVGEWYYIFRTTATRIDTAVRRAARRCMSLRDRTGVKWLIDDGAQRDGAKRSCDYVYVGDHPLLKELELTF